MPSFVEREKLSGLHFLDLGIVQDTREIADRTKILSLNRRVEACVRQSFHRCRCLEPVQWGPKLVLEQPHLRHSLCTLRINLVEDCRSHSVLLMHQDGYLNSNGGCKLR